MKNDMGGRADPIKDKEEIAKNPDNKIDQDFKGYPHGPATDKTINPSTENEKKAADVENKDGEKRVYNRNETDEQDPDGSANAFDDK